MRSTKVREDKWIARASYPVHWEHSKHKNIFVTGKQKNKLPPLGILNWLFRYDSDTGKLYKIRLASGKPLKREKEITYVDNNRYLRVGIVDSNSLQKWFLVHHVVYYMVSGEEPLQLINHIDTDKLNNRFDNLRLIENGVSV